MPRFRLAVIRGIAGVICLSVLLCACVEPASLFMQAESTPTRAPVPTPYKTAIPAPTLPLPARFEESPDLAALVHTNQLPPVSKRLPEHPKVVRLVEREGRYGGLWRMVIQSYSDTAQFIRTVSYEPLVRWTSDWSGIEANLVERYSVNRNATEYTFTLRRGLRWSDGEPFTTKDIRFWYEDVLLNAQLTPVIPAWLKARGETAKFVFVDDVTFKVRFLAANSLFLQQLATPDALMITAFPVHYASKFHAKYAKIDELDSLVQEGGYSSWVDLFMRRVGVNALDGGNFSDPARPRLSAWVITSQYETGETGITWKRNPYYWKVDPNGKQLPYIGDVVFIVADNMDKVINQAVDSIPDMQDLSELGTEASATFLDHPNGGYKTYRLQDSTNNIMVINLNLTHPDLEMRQIFQNQNFRIALSYAINRPEILNLLFNGKGTPWQASPRPDSLFYDPLMGRQYTEYSPQKANEYLDKAGLPTDEMGHRLGLDGLPISFSVDVLENKPLQIATLNLVSKHLSEVGINLQPKIEPLPVFLATVRSNKHDAAAWDGGGTNLADVLLKPVNYLPTSADSLWAIGWANWYNQAAVGAIEPEDEMMQALGMYDQVNLTLSTSEQIRLMRRSLQMAQVSFWTIGIALGPDQYGIVRNSFHNVPAEMPASWIYPNPAPTNPEQYFVE